MYVHITVGFARSEKEKKLIGYRFYLRLRWFYTFKQYGTGGREDEFFVDLFNGAQQEPMKPALVLVRGTSQCLNSRQTCQDWSFSVQLSNHCCSY